MSDTIDELLSNDFIELLYGNLSPIFGSIRSKKIKLDPNLHTHEFSKQDLAGIKIVKRFTEIPSERHCQFETELPDGRQIKVSCKINDDGVAIVAAKII